MSWIIEKYRKEAYDGYVGTFDRFVPWRQAILECIFRPRVKLPPGKGPMTHLHPNIDKLHLPEGVYIADWRKYRVEDHPALINFQKKCHAVGLHDPFLRNYAYMYYPTRYHHRSRIAFMTQGISFGFAMAAALFVVGKVYNSYFPSTYAHTKEYIEKYGTGEKSHH